MPERNHGLLLASIQMALAGRDPMTANEIAAYLTRMNQSKPFSGSDVIAAVRSRPDLFVVENRRFLGLGPPRWRLARAGQSPGDQPRKTPSASAVTGSTTPARIAQPQRGQPSRPAPRPALKTTRQNPILDLIDEQKPASDGAGMSSAELSALRREIRRRRAKGGAAVPLTPGQIRYRELIDPDHPINLLDDETLKRLQADRTPYIDSD